MSLACVVHTTAEDVQLLHTGDCNQPGAYSHKLAVQSQADCWKTVQVKPSDQRAPKHILHNGMIVMCQQKAEQL